MVIPIMPPLNTFIKENKDSFSLRQMAKTQYTIEKISIFQFQVRYMKYPMLKIYDT